MIKYLTKDEILFVNHQTYIHHGGLFTPPNNLKHEENLEYLLEAVKSEMFGEPLYPTISDKAAVYCFNVVCNHIFHDGNKRTGLQSASLFLRLNEYRINKNKRHIEVTNFIFDVASGNVTLNECRAWFAENIVAI